MGIQSLSPPRARSHLQEQPKFVNRFSLDGKCFGKNFVEAAPVRVRFNFRE